MQQTTALVLHSERLPGDMALLVLDAPVVASDAQPGQFVMVRCGELPLRRPLSVHAAGDGRLALLFRVTGAGTAWLAALEPGARVDLTGPLGNRYTVPPAGAPAVLIAGGLGVAPLFFLAARLSEPDRATLAYGARSRDELYQAPEALRSLIPEVTRVDDVQVRLATDDGSAGVRGTALDVALPLLDTGVNVYVCGPVGMCAAAGALIGTRHDITVGGVGAVCSPTAAERLASAEVSLEVRMACGVGACYGCSISTREGRRKVCTDGPVFRFGDILWEEVVT